MKRIKAWIATFHPLYQRRQDRLVLVESIKLPHCQDTLKKVHRISYDLHPDLDHFLTFDERIRLLTASGWIRQLDGNYYLMANRHDRLMAITVYLKTAELNLKDELKVYNCGLDY